MADGSVLVWVIQPVPRCLLVQLMATVLLGVTLLLVCHWKNAGYYNREAKLR
ncbi:tumor necrosis factor receptor superfamily member 8 [Anopheles sinensis]|uniref:Tumor necrosis factor receptor superfamily member 8 n=1 Tax=Anopheles sinensis TaxID=74873 RepID=A0A084VYZ4_ANOSI|nr:tumor necrosis factor receptor superfamily member 8 [Anopheles sinensis]